MQIFTQSSLQAPVDARATPLLMLMHVHNAQDTRGIAPSTAQYSSYSTLFLVSVQSLLIRKYYKP